MTQGEALVGVDSVGARRANAPAQQGYATGSLTVARKIMRSHRLRELARIELRGGIYALTTAPVRGARVRTLRTLAQD
eukprot:9081153-Karenia_brevis.AAC.1